ncbi:MAG: IS110 family transposase [Lachnospiraceae bacterium]
MISVGIDVSKGKSTVCMLKANGEVIRTPFEVSHTDDELTILTQMIQMLKNEEIRVVLEATGIYHLPVVTFLQQENIFVCVVNPLLMKKYGDIKLRQGKTDKMDSIKIANYGIDNWYHLTDFLPEEETYAELRLLSRQYLHYTSLKIKAKVNLTNLLEKTMPGIKPLLRSQSEHSNQEKLCAVVSRYWHFDNITRYSENRFVKDFTCWAKKKGFYANEKKAYALYSLAKQGVTTLPSYLNSTKVLIKEAVRVLSELEATLTVILSDMKTLAEELPGYQVALSMPGIGPTLAVRIVAEVGDICRFHSANALIAYAGLDSPPHQSGLMNAKRSISKRGSPALRKTGFEIINSIRKTKPTYDNAIYLFMQKKENEGKPIKVAKIAGLNKFLRIYYARVKESFNG